MKIEQIELRHVVMRLVAPFETSFGVEQDRACIIVTMRAGGLTGLGECVAAAEPGYCYETTTTAWHILRDFLVPSVLGQESGADWSIYADGLASGDRETE